MSARVGMRTASLPAAGSRHGAHLRTCADGPPRVTGTTCAKTCVTARKETYACPMQTSPVRAHGADPGAGDGRGRPDEPDDGPRPADAAAPARGRDRLLRVPDPQAAHPPGPDAALRARPGRSASTPPPSAGTPASSRTRACSSAPRTPTTAAPAGSRSPSTAAPAWRRRFETRRHVITTALEGWSDERARDAPRPCSPGSSRACSTQSRRPPPHSHPQENPA